MNEPKRRGRPPKALIEGADVAAPEVEEPQPTVPADASEAQAYALRVWHGQSVSLPRNERTARVKRALEGQGMSFEGVTLP